jgi:hypothetical protein
MVNSIARVLIAALAFMSFLPLTVVAQDEPFGDSEFVSPKFGTVIEWEDDWNLDPETSSIEVRRDVLGLIQDGEEAAVLIELQSQRSFRTGAEFINAALQRYSQLPEFEITDDSVDQSPASLQFTFLLDDLETVVAGYIQAQPIEGATMVVIVLSTPGEVEQTNEIANDAITVNRVPLLEALPICGEDDGEAEDTGKPSASSGSSKPDNKTGSGSSSANTPATCVEVFQSTSSDQPRPTPTPEPQQSRTDTFNSRTWSAGSFPNVSVSYDRDDWSVQEDLVAAENNGRDGVLLFHNSLPAYVIVEVFDGFNGRAGACIDVALAEAGISPGSDELITDDDGNPIQGSQQGRVWSAYAFDVETDDGTTSVGGYVECRSLPGASGVMIFTMVSNIVEFQTSFDAIQSMLRSIRLG